MKKYIFTIFMAAAAMHLSCSTGRHGEICDAGILNEAQTICCAARCGQCGGRRCSSRPGGSQYCCELAITREFRIQGEYCNQPMDVSCVVDPTKGSFEGGALFDGFGDLDSVTVNADVRPSGKKFAPRIALCFFGLNRSLRFTSDSVHTNVIAPLRSAGFSVDLFFHTYRIAWLLSSRSGEVTPLYQNPKKKMNSNFSSIRPITATTPEEGVALEGPEAELEALGGPSMVRRWVATDQASFRTT